MTSNVGEEIHDEVVITTGSRLHAGFYMVGHGGPWGSAAFYVEEPSFKARVRQCGKPSIKGAGESLEPIERAIRELGLGVCIDVYSEIPRHTGLGSTTQVMLGVACAGRVLEGRECDPIELARILGRGRVSGAGTLAFKYGGFVADAGSPDRLGPRLLLRHGIPGDWRFIVVIPEAGRGLSEELEEPILSKPWKPSPESERLMAKGFLRLAQSIARADLQGALEGLRMMQLGTGMYFVRAQGGVYRSDLQEVAAEASRYGIYMAQSSWGPTLYTINTAREAEGDAYILRGILEDLGIGGRVLVVKPRNRGASIARASGRRDN